MVAATEPGSDRRTGDFALPVPIYLVSFLLIGLAVSVLGPALTELRERSGADIGSIGVLFVGLSAGYVVASFVFGRLYDKTAGHRVYAASLTVMAIGLVMVPLFDALGALFAAFVVIGVGAGSIDVGGNTMIVWHLGAGVGRAMNTLHLSFAVGALVAPLFVYVGLRAATWSAAAASLVIAAWAVSTASPSAPARVRAEHTDSSPRLLALLAVFFLLYVGLEVGYAGWLPTYGEEIGMSELAATWLITVFWIGFTAGRVVASAMGRRSRPRMVLLWACLLTIGAAALVALGDGRTVPLWVGTAIIGFATAPQFPGMMTYLERRIRVTGLAMSWFVAAAGLGGLLFPWLIGRWIDTGGAGALPAAALLLALATLASFLVSDRVLGG